jgi:phage gpG-like protein
MLASTIVTGTEKLAALAETLHLRARTVVEADTRKLLASVRQKLSGEVLQSRTGRLRESIRASVSGLEGRVESDGSVPYARIQDMGGVIKVPEIFPAPAKALAFAYGGRLVFAKHTAAHQVDIPARSYMRASLDEIAPVIAADMRHAIESALS